MRSCSFDAGQADQFGGNQREAIALVGKNWSWIGTKCYRFGKGSMSTQISKGSNFSRFAVLVNVGGTWPQYDRMSLSVLSCSTMYPPASRSASESAPGFHTDGWAHSKTNYARRKRYVNFGHLKPLDSKFKATLNEEQSSEARPWYRGIHLYVVRSDMLLLIKSCILL